jgi:hypothetical protein
MSVSTEWCTKKQAAKLIGRTERTLSRIVRDAVEHHSEEVLSNLKLTYTDGREVPGRDVTLELLAKNEKEGSRTRWFFRKLWWQDDFAPRLAESAEHEADDRNPDATANESKPERGVADAALGEPPPLPIDPAVRSVVLEHLHYSDRKHAIDLQQLTNRVLQVVETNQQLQGQTNTLYNQFQEALKQSGGLKALVIGTQTAPESRTHHEHPGQAEVIDSHSEQSPASRVVSRPAKRAGTRPKSSVAKSNANDDIFPTFRRIARFLTRK